MENKVLKRKIRHRRARSKIYGTKSRPRLSVFRSSKHLELQLIDDAGHRTLFGLNDYKLKKGTKGERAERLGRAAGKEIFELGFRKVIFDRGGYKYHGRIKVLAEALRKAGVKF
jgi:large subunit ribosomal protein L18